MEIDEFKFARRSGTTFHSRHLEALLAFSDFRCVGQQFVLIRLHFPGVHKKRACHERLNSMDLCLQKELEGSIHYWQRNPKGLYRGYWRSSALL